VVTKKVPGPAAPRTTTPRGGGPANDGRDRIGGTPPSDGEEGRGEVTTQTAPTTTDGATMTFAVGNQDLVW
jgi:hypothetical protein